MATFTVTSTSGDPLVSGSLPWAVGQANMAAGADTIVFASGVTGAVNLAGAGSLKIDDAVTLTGPGAGALTIVADADSQVFDVNSTAVPLFDASLSGLTLTGVNGLGGAAIAAADVNLRLTGMTMTGNVADPSAAGAGGVVLVGSGNLTIENSTISNNSGFTGGVQFGAAGILSIKSSTISGNTGDAASGGGGGIDYVAGNGATIEGSTISGNTGLTGGLSYFGGGDLAIKSSTISGNSGDALAGASGGVDFFGDNMTIEGSTVSNNTGFTGGVSHQGLGDLTVKSSTISGNTGDLTSSGGFNPPVGGLLYLGFGPAKVVIEASTISGNAAGDDGGGGLFVFSGGTVTVSGSTISGNSGGAGGASLISLDTATVVNTTIANNTGSVLVGGLELNSFAGAIVRNSTIYNNTIGIAVPDSVDGLLASFDTLVQNSIIYSAGGRPDIGSDGGQVTADYSLLGDYLSICGCFLVIEGGNNITGVDPLLGPLANNGGPVMTMLPPLNSPVVNAGRNALSIGLVYDARGLARFMGGAIDMGAVELQLASPTGGTGGGPGAGGATTSFTPTPSPGSVVAADFTNLLRFGSYGGSNPLPATVVTPTAQVVANPLLVQQLAVQSLIAQVDAGSLTRQQALDRIVDMADATTSVATMSYQFFTGKLPTKEGLDYLVSSPANPADLNDGFYAGMSLENRYINMAVNLARPPGQGAAGFAANYGALSLADAAAKAYAEIFGPPPAGRIADILTPDRIAYFNALGGDALGAKAAMVGFLLAESAKSDVGRYAVMNENFLYDLADGVAAYGADLTIYLGAGPRTVGLVGAAGEF